VAGNLEIMIEHRSGLGFMLRIFAVFAVVTGSLDLLFGGGLLVASGAVLATGSATDPLIDSQLRFLGAIWAGYGVMLWWTAGNLRSRMTPLAILSATMFVAGLGRTGSALLHGIPSPLVIVFIAIELIGPPLVLALVQAQPIDGGKGR
jgi:Domain of unknown function (DUF4345)